MDRELRRDVQMATTPDARNLKPVDLAAEHSPAAQADKASFIGGLRFDWLMVVLTGWMIGGIYLGWWADNHGQGDTRFFTPWPAFLYSGYLAVTLLPGVSMIVNHRRGPPPAQGL